MVVSGHFRTCQDAHKPPQSGGFLLQVTSGSLKASHTQPGTHENLESKKNGYDSQSESLTQRRFGAVVIEFQQRARRFGARRRSCFEWVLPTPNVLHGNITENLGFCGSMKTNLSFPLSRRRPLSFGGVSRSIPSCRFSRRSVVGSSLFRYCWHFVWPIPSIDFVMSNPVTELRSHEIQFLRFRRHRISRNFLRELQRSLADLPRKPASVTLGRYHFLKLGLWGETSSLGELRLAHPRDRRTEPSPELHRLSWLILYRCLPRVIPPIAGLLRAEVLIAGMGSGRWMQSKIFCPCWRSFPSGLSCTSLTRSFSAESMIHFLLLKIGFSCFGTTLVVKAKISPFGSTLIRV